MKLNYQPGAILTYYFYDEKIRTSYKNIPKYDLDDVMGFGGIASLVYQTELLSVFNIDRIDELCNEHYKIVEETLGSNTIQKLLEIIENSNPSCIGMGLPILLSYDYYFITNKLMQTIIQNKTINYDYLDEMCDYVISMNKI
jgi:hypothetical protein